MAHLLFVNHTGRLSGPARSLLKLFNHIRADHDIAVLVPDEGDFTEVLTRENLPWRVFPFRYRHLPALAWLLQRGEYDLVYGNNFSGASWHTLIAAKFARRPFVWHIREIFAKSPTNPKVFRRPRYADAIIAVSEASAIAIKNYLPDKQVSIVYNGIDIDEFSSDRDEARKVVFKNLGFSTDSVLIISVGHLCPRKNQFQAVEVIAKIVHKYPFVRFVILGRLDHTSSYTDKVKHKIKQLGLEENVLLLGFKKDVSAYLEAADIFMHTAIGDPHPRSVLEGMAAELPVVAFGVDGVSETVISGQTGYLLPPGDVIAMTHALGELIEDASLRQLMGENGSVRVMENFTTVKTARQINTVIERVLKN